MIWYYTLHLQLYLPRSSSEGKDNDFDDMTMVTIVFLDCHDYYDLITLWYDETNSPGLCDDQYDSDFFDGREMNDH